MLPSFPAAALAHHTTRSRLVPYCYRAAPTSVTTLCAICKEMTRGVAIGAQPNTALGQTLPLPFVRLAAGLAIAMARPAARQVNHALVLVHAARLGDISFAVCLKQGRQVGDALAYANATVGVCHTHGIGARVVNDLLMGACDVIVCG